MVTSILLLSPVCLVFIIFTDTIYFSARLNLFLMHNSFVGSSKWLAQGVWRFQEHGRTHATMEGRSLLNTSLTLNADVFLLGPLLDLTAFVSSKIQRYLSLKQNLSLPDSVLLLLLCVCVRARVYVRVCVCTRVCNSRRSSSVNSGYEYWIMSLALVSDSTESSFVGQTKQRS